MLRTPLIRRPRRLLVLSLSVVAVLAACGGDDEADDGVDTTTAAESGTDASSPATVTAGSIAVDATPGTPPTVPAASSGSGAEEDIEAYIEAGAEAVDTGDEEAARCLSAALINGVGAENVLATGLSPEEFYNSASIEDAGVVLTDQIREDVEANVLGCGDLVQVILDTIDDETEANCVRETLNNELIAEQIAVGLVGTTPSPELQAALAAAQTCATG